MKTVLLINSSGARFFRRDQGTWHQIEQPDAKDKLWVIANLGEETLEAFNFPLLFGRDRSNFIERRLIAAFPNSQYRAAPVISGGLIKSGTAILTGISSDDLVSSHLDKLDISIAGVWGEAMLLTLMVKRLAIANIVLALPSVHHMRILVIKDGLPVLTRCVRRFSEDNNDEHDSDASEILRTRQHLENHRIFENESIPPLLYLGDSTSIAPHLTQAGFTLLSIPVSLAPKGDADYLHLLFEFVVSSPHGQLAPLKLRARHLAENLRRASYLGIAASLLGIVLFGQDDFRSLIGLHQREQTLHTEMQLATNERDRLADSISASGKDPELVRQATRFADIEMDSSPTPESIFQLASTVIAELPQVRIKTLAFRFPAQGERYCEGHSVIELPLIGQNIDLSALSGSKPSGTGAITDIPPRYIELQFTILLTENVAPAAQIEIRKHISATLKTMPGIQLMSDPAAFSLTNTLKGGMGMDTTQTENLWCMSLAWKNSPAKDQP